MQDDTEMLTIDEVAKQLRVNEKTVRNWITSGELPAFPIGKRGYRISKTDLHNFVEARKQRLRQAGKNEDEE